MADVERMKQNMGKEIYSGRIVSDFQGFDENAVFKLSNGTFWVQARYEYWYHYAYMPAAKIIDENGRTFLSVAGRTVPVNRVYDVIESRIDGTFEGWKGNTKYTLTNGQEWQQAEYKYEYKYAYSPEVIICNVNGSYIMYVEETIVAVRQV